MAEQKEPSGAQKRFGNSLPRWQIGPTTCCSGRYGPERSCRPRPLIVAMPHTPDANDLPGAETEASDLAGRFQRMVAERCQRSCEDPKRWRLL